MGRRIDQLPNLDDTPIAAPDPDERETPWSRFLEEIEDLLNTGHYTWAEDTLSGIYDTVQKKQFVTEGQRTAVANIAAGLTKRRGGWR